MNPDGRQSSEVRESTMSGQKVSLTADALGDCAVTSKHLKAAGQRFQLGASDGCLYSRSQIATLMFSLMLMVCLTGCWHTYHVQQFQELPKSEGDYVGSILWEPWEYFGSGADYHYIQYSYHRDTCLRSIDIRFPTHEVRLRLLRMVPYQSDPVCALEPVLVERKLTGFEWKPWRWNDPAFHPRLRDSAQSNAFYSLHPLELKLAPPPKIEDSRPHP